MTVQASQLKILIQNRLNNRIETIASISTVVLEDVPEAVQRMREEESAKLRAVMQEQKDILEIISMLFPDA